MVDNIPRTADPIKCGSKRVYRQRFDLRVYGVPLSCKRARGIAAHPCSPYPKKIPWSCFSIREAGPFLLWFPTEEVFAGPWSTAILLKRYPCAKAHVTPRLFARGTTGFPTRRQMLADDLLRCHMIDGRGPRQVTDLIGEPDERFRRGERVWFVYWLGPERESYVLIDPEGLELSFVRGRLRSATFFQG